MAELASAPSYITSAAVYPCAESCSLFYIILRKAIDSLLFGLSSTLVAWRSSTCRYITFSDKRISRIRSNNSFQQFPPPKFFKPSLSFVKLLSYTLLNILLTNAENLLQFQTSLYSQEKQSYQDYSMAFPVTLCSYLLFEAVGNSL